MNVLQLRDQIAALAARTGDEDQLLHQRIDQLAAAILSAPNQAALEAIVAEFLQETDIRVDPDQLQTAINNYLIANPTLPDEIAEKVEEYFDQFGYTPAPETLTPVLRTELTYSVAGTFSWERPPSCVAVEVEMAAGGGGSGGITETGVANATGVSAGGGAGGWAKGRFDVSGLTAPVTVTVGAGGTAGEPGVNGGDGGDSSFGAYLVTRGGKGSVATTVTASTARGRGALGGVVGTGAGMHVAGGDGGGTVVVTGQYQLSNYGGANPLSSSPNPSSNGNGFVGRRYGGGASGASTTGAARNGAAGAAGVVIVREFHDLLRASPADPGPQEMQTLNWVVDDAAFFPPSAGGAWAQENIYFGWIARNLDGTAYRDENGDLYLYYTGDNNVGTDYDQIGLALGPDLENMTNFGTDPVIPLGPDPSPDAGDAQSPCVFYTGSGFVMYYHGNATPAGSPDGQMVRLCKATSVDGKDWVKQGQILGPGGVGDNLHLFNPRIIPNAPGGPRMYYVGNQNNVLGIMGARSDSIQGPWTRLSNAQLLQDGLTFLGDAWYENGLYHFIYFPGGLGPSPGGIVYANSPDGLNLTRRTKIIPRVPGAWNDAPQHPSRAVIDGVTYMIHNGSSGVGLGYYTGVPT